MNTSQEYITQELLGMISNHTKTLENTNENIRSLLKIVKQLDERIKVLESKDQKYAVINTPLKAKY